MTVCLLINLLLAATGWCLSSDGCYP